MTFLLTNDDGIDAPGIAALQQAVDGKGIIVAPTQPISGCGHRVTTSSGIAVKQRTDNAYAVAGTPADCTRLGLTHLVPQTSWVLSGINAGGNLGADIYISGTVAAVREAAFHNIPAIAISHWIKRPLVIDWDIATAWTKQVLAVLWEKTLPPKSFWNVNLPHLLPDSPAPSLVFCELGNDPLPVDYRVEGDLYYYQGEYGQRDRAPNSDVDVCFSGNIAITLIQL